jgi:hypothetical protein
MKGSRLFALLALPVILGAPRAMASDTFCAFEIKVEEPSRRPVADVSVTMVQHGDTAFGPEVRTGADGTVKLCDAPLAPIDIVVGFDRCGAVMIKHVMFDWISPKKILVTYAPSRCGEFVFPEECHILFRIIDGDGRPLAGAGFSASQDRDLPVSDEFGRLFRSVGDGQLLNGTVRKSGFKDATVSVRCTQEGEHNIEIKVPLERR